MSPQILGIISLLPAWLLVLFRITGIFVFAPVLGSRTIPPRIKALWALGMSFVIFPMLLSPSRPAAEFVMNIAANGLYLWAIAGMIAMELIIGIVIGYGASLPLLGFQVGGRVIDQQLGIGLAGIYNPELDEQSGITGEFFFLVGLSLFVLMNGHRVMVDILVRSFDVYPLGGFRFDGEMLTMIIGLLQMMFELAFRVAGPLLCIIFLMTIAMGFIARTVPQMNILSIGFPVRILIGFILVLGAIGSLAHIFLESMDETLNTLGAFIGVGG